MPQVIRDAIFQAKDDIQVAEPKVGVYQDYPPATNRQGGPYVSRCGGFPHATLPGDHYYRLPWHSQASLVSPNLSGQTPLAVRQDKVQW